MATQTKGARHRSAVVAEQRSKQQCISGPQRHQQRVPAAMGGIIQTHHRLEHHGGFRACGRKEALSLYWLATNMGRGRVLTVTFRVLANLMFFQSIVGAGVSDGERPNHHRALEHFNEDVRRVVFTKELSASRGPQQYQVRQAGLLFTHLINAIQNERLVQSTHLFTIDRLASGKSSFSLHRSRCPTLCWSS